MKRKLFAMILSLTLAFSMAVTAQAGELKGTIVVSQRNTGAVAEVYDSIFEAFMAENPGVVIEHQIYTDDYENLMKAKMAANDLPDVFVTHGWSVMRYSEYLLPLNEEPWAAEVSDTLKASVYDAEGNLYVLPMTVDWTGILVQMDVLNELGLELPETVEEFLHCCEVAKQAGYTGVFMAGKDTRSPAYVLDLMASSFLLNSGDDANATALLNGSFDWNKWAPVNDFLVTLREKGYMNVDCATADTIAFAEMLLTKQTLFIYQRNSVLSEVWNIDPEANVGFFPFPALTAEDAPYLAGGEGHAFGIWKDSEHIDIAKALLAFMAKPEYIAKLCEADGSAPGLKGVELNAGKLNGFFERWNSVQTLPWFDRVYLPSGMWAILRDTGSAVVAGEATTEEVISVLKDNYGSMFAQQ